MEALAGEPRARAAGGTWISHLPALAIFGGLALYGALACRYGIGFTDEGMKLSVPHRYALGDLPFRDEVLTAGRSFGIVLWPLFALSPDVSVLELRYLSIALQLASAGAFFAVLARFASPLLVAAALAATAFMARVGFWTPAYNILGVHLCMLGLALWILGCLAHREVARSALGATGGLAFALGVVAYNSFVLSALVPLLAWLSALRRGDRAVSRASLAFLASGAVLGLGVIGWLWSEGLIADFRDAVALVGAQPQYRPTLGERLLLFARGLEPWLPHVAGVAAVIAVAGWLLSRGGSLMRWVLPPALAVALLPLVHMPRVAGIKAEYHVSFCVMAAALAVAGVSIGHQLLQPAADDRPDANAFRFVQRVAVPAIVLNCTIHALTSSNSFFNFRHGVGPLFAIGVVGLARTLYARGGATLPRPALCTLLTICALYTGVHLPARAAMIYADGPLPTLTATFEHPRLSGVRSTPERVQAVEGLLAFLSARVRRGDALMEYGGAPILYYLTGARPAGPIAWISPRTPEGIRSHAAAYIAREQGVARYAVRTLREAQVWKFRPDDPLNALIVNNYKKIARFGEFEVWERVSAPRTLRGPP